MRTPIIDHLSRQGAPADCLFGIALATALTPLALAVHGYHPYSEDGGLYVAGIKRLLHPELYAASAPFVDAHLRYSLFAPMVAALVRATHLSLPAVLLLIHLASIWTTLYAFWLIAKPTLTTRAASSGAVLLLALCLTLPVAGTALILSDPYVTARSLSLPCTLFALAAALRTTQTERSADHVRASILSALLLLLAGLLHPLMAWYALGSVLLLLCFSSTHTRICRWGTVALCAAILLAAALLQALAPPEPAAYFPIALSRYYWFLSRWRWYEILGLIAPLAILVAAALRSGPAKPLARMAVAAGTTAILIALFFAHADATTHLVARLQPLRLFQLVYMVMILVLGGLLGEHVLRARLWRWLAAIALFGAIFFAVERATYPASSHIEWPNSSPTNRYEQAFVWISHNTPVDALFALDAHYISAPSEDAQGFRALAERSALPDYSKDGGEASITPSLTPAWTAAQQAQTELNQRTDAERLAALRPLNVTWIVLPRDSTTAFACPFRNASVAVCRLP